MIKRLLITALLGCAVSGVHASQNYLPLGSNFTWGATSHHQYLMSHTNNPATGATTLEWRNGGFAMGLVGPVALSIDAGPLGQAAEVTSDLSTLVEDFQSFGSAEAGDINLDVITNTLEVADRSLGTLGDSLDLNIKLGFQVPLFPMVITHKKFGSVTLDLNSVASVRAQFLDSPLASNPLIDPLEGIDSKYTTNSSLYLKVANVFETALGYSREVYRDNKGILYAGAKLNMYSVFMNKSLYPIVSMDAAAEEAEEQALNGDGSQMNVGLDVGAIWMADYYRLGANIRNINAPSFSYNNIGVGCSGKSSVEAVDNCYREQAFAGVVDLKEEYVMYPQINIEATVFSKSRNWVASAAIETNAANDPVGNPYQWASISGGYAAPNQLLPGVRVGYRKNLAGSQLSYLSVGLNWMMIYLDAAMSMQKMDFPDTYNMGDGEQETPAILKDFGYRSVYLSIGTDFVW